MLIVHQDFDCFRDVRLKILTASYNCLTCWVILLAPGASSLGRPSPFWQQLIGLARFYECKKPERYGSTLNIRLRLAFNYPQVGYIINDVAKDLESNDIRTSLQPMDEEVKGLLHHPQFNAVSAQLILQHISPTEIENLPNRKLKRRLPCENLRRLIKVS